MGLITRAGRNLWRKKTRTILVTLALAFSIAAIVSVQSGVQASQSNTQEMIDETVADTQERVNSTIADYNALMENVEKGMEDVENVTDLQLRQISVTAGFGGPGGGGRPGGADGFVQPDPIDDDVIEDILSLDGVEGVVPYITQRVGEDFRNPDYQIWGMPLDDELNAQYNYLPATIVEGRQLSENDSAGLLINMDLKYFFDAGVNDTVEIEGYDFTIVGICSSTVSFFGSSVYMSVSDAQLIAGYASDEYRGLYVYAESEEIVDTVAYDIEELYPEYRTMTYGEFGGMGSDMIKRMQDMQLAELEEEKNASVAQLETEMNAQITQLEEDMKGIENTGNQIVIISAITAGLIMLFMMSYTVRERIREIGTLKAIGFTDGSVMFQFILEGTTIGAIAGGVGIVLALIAAPFLSDVLLPSSDAFSISGISPVLVLMALGATALLGALGSLYPAWDAARKSPVEAMRHE